jgi:hypothetical protein
MPPRVVRRPRVRRATIMEPPSANLHKNGRSHKNAIGPTPTWRNHSQSITSSGSRQARPSVLSVSRRLYAARSVDRVRPPLLRFLGVSSFDRSTCRVVNWFIVPFTPSLLPSGPGESTGRNPRNPLQNDDFETRQHSPFRQYPFGMVPRAQLYWTTVASAVQFPANPTRVLLAKWEM